MKTADVVVNKFRPDEARDELGAIKHMLSRFGYDVGPNESVYEAVYRILAQFHPKD